MDETEQVDRGSNGSHKNYLSPAIGDSFGNICGRDFRDCGGLGDGGSRWGGSSHW